MNCFKCGLFIESGPLKKIGFRDYCENCGASLHCCLGCKYYQVGLSNNCKIPGTEKIVDCSANNFCEEFAVREQESVSTKKNSGGAARFDDLFK